MPRVSIAIPYHTAPNTAFYLSRLLASIQEQTFKDYEIVTSKSGAFARNHNAAIVKSRGEIVKIMQMDDFFSHHQALEMIVNTFDANPEEKWLISATKHTDGTKHDPMWTDDIYTGNNRLGSVSSISFRRECGVQFEEPLTWLVDCDWYYRMFIKYGLPIIHPDYGVTVDVRTDRLSHTLSDELKRGEIDYLIKKYGK